MALGWASRIEGATGFRPEVVHNNEALAPSALVRTTAARRRWSERLLLQIRWIPIFLMTAAFIAEHQDKIASAVRYNRQALAVDPGAFPVANDLAASSRAKTISARLPRHCGWPSAARRATPLAGSTSCRREPPRPLHVPSAEGAFARAYALEPALRDRKHVTTIDESVYRTGVHLSKPLPPSRASPSCRGRCRSGPPDFSRSFCWVPVWPDHRTGGKALAQDWLGLVDERLGRVPWLRRLRNPCRPCWPALPCSCCRSGSTPGQPPKSWPTRSSCSSWSVLRCSRGSRSPGPWASVTIRLVGSWHRGSASWRAWPACPGLHCRSSRPMSAVAGASRRAVDPLSAERLALRRGGLATGPPDPVTCRRRADHGGVHSAADRPAGRRSDRRKPESSAGAGL